MESLLNDKEKRLLNVLAKEERTASATYEYFANCMMSHGLFGAKKFFLAESRSELDHYQKIASFMNDLGCEVDMPTVESVDMELEGLGEILEASYEMEKALLELYEDSYSESGVTPKFKSFVQDMIDGQVKSVGEYGDLIMRFSLVGDNVLLFDQELGNG
jgi:ferritin